MAIVELQRQRYESVKSTFGRYVSPEVDSRTRTVQARAALANPDGKLRANMYGEARIVLGSRGEAVTVPADAVQRVKDVFFVFVQTRDDEFEVRRVVLGARERAVTELTSGVASTGAAGTAAESK